MEVVRMITPLLLIDIAFSSLQNNGKHNENASDNCQ